MKYPYHLQRNPHYDPFFEIPPLPTTSAALLTDAPLFSLASSFREHFWGPMRNPTSDSYDYMDPLEDRIKKLCLFSDLSAEEISDAMNIPYLWAEEACRTYRRDYFY